MEDAWARKSAISPAIQTKLLRVLQQKELQRVGGEETLKVPTGDRPLPDILEELVRELIRRAYEKANGVKTETARLLGIKTSALYYKLEKYGFIQKGEADTQEG